MADGGDRSQGVAVVIAGAGALIAVGVLLPWMVFNTTSENYIGLDAMDWKGFRFTEGKIALGGGLAVVVAGLVGLLQPQSRRSITGLTLGGAVAAGVAAVMAYFKIGNDSTIVDPLGDTSSFDPGLGLWLGLVGAIVALVAGVLWLSQGKGQTPPLGEPSV